MMLMITIPPAATKKAKRLKDKCKRDYKKLIKEIRIEKPIHGKFPSYLDKEYIYIKQSFQWMKHSEHKGKTEEELIIAAQDQALHINTTANTY